jgi:hypothetical protein
VSAFAFHHAQQQRFFLGQKVAITLIVQFELSDSTAWITLRILEVNREIENTAQHFKLSIHRSLGTSSAILGRRLYSFMLELLN